MFKNFIYRKKNFWNQKNPKNKLDRLRNKNICLHLLYVFYPTQPSSKQIFCFDFEKQNSVLPIVF